MPHYTFRNKKTNEEFDLEMKIAEMEEYLEKNPDIEQIIGGSFTLGDPLKLGVSKNPRMIEFQKYVLPKIAANNPLGKIGKETRFQLRREW